MKRNKFICALIATVFFMTSCDLLDRPNPQVMSDSPEFWRQEANLRMFAQEFYPNFFVGFPPGFVVVFAPVRGQLFCDNLAAFGAPLAFPTAVVPATVGATGNGLMWNGAFWNGPTWNFYWIRKANLMINRMENYSRGAISDEAFYHWMAKARFFKALEYSRLVGTFGDVPWFEREIVLTDRAELFRDRDPRNFVMDRVYDEFRWVLANIRERGSNRQELNRDIVLAFVSRWMLFEGTWQWYHNNDADRAAKFLNFVVEASQELMGGDYRIDGSLRSLFSNVNGAMSGNEVILWRTYSRGLTMHAVSSYNNFNESLYRGANASLIKSFITTEGDVWQNVTGAEDFSLENLLRTRDPRFEASFARRLRDRSPTGIYDVRFISRNAINIEMLAIDNPGDPNFPPLTLANNARFPDYTGSTNTTSFPIIRLGEILLNWIEARAVLAEAGRGPAVTQPDIDNSINLLRRRPIDAQARALFDLDYTAPMQLASLPQDPERLRINEVVGGRYVSNLMWEIRRERRMELFQEFPRMLDLRRWNSLGKLNTVTNPEIVLSTWINFADGELNGLLTREAANNGTVIVQTMDGTRITFVGGYGYLLNSDVDGLDENQFPPNDYFLDEDGERVYAWRPRFGNLHELRGFRVMNLNAQGVVQNRTDAQQPRFNLAPVGTNQINLYEQNGFTLTQTPGW